MVTHEGSEREAARDDETSGEAAASRCCDPVGALKRTPLLYEASLFAAGATAVYAAVKSARQHAVLPRIAWRALAGITGMEFAGMLLTRRRCKRSDDEDDEDKS